MQPIVENWTDLRGDVVAVRPVSGGSFVEADVRVGDLHPVEGYANLLDSARDQVIPIRIPLASLSGATLDPGATVSLRARQAGPRVGAAFAHPDFVRVES